VEHLNGNTMDNRRRNLRISNQSLNNLSINRAQRNSKTGARNVFPTRNGTFRAVVMRRGKPAFEKIFKTITQASRAASEVRRRLAAVGA